MIVDEDQVLVENILEGSKSSFEELMRKYNKKIYGYIYRMVTDEEVAIELTQDFFIKVYRILGKYKHEYKFATWAYRICHNMVIDYVRRHQAPVDSLDDQYISQKQMMDSENIVKENGFDHLAKEEFNQYLWRVVDCMPMKYRELILLRYLQGFKYDEIAEVTRLPLGTVKNRMYKAKAILKAEIEKDGMFN